MNTSTELTRETIKETVENFFEKFVEKELSVANFLDATSKQSICNFNIGSEYREIAENSTHSELVIADYTTPISMIPDDVSIRYADVIQCEEMIRTGETEDDILANVLEVTFRTGMVLELGFLNM